MSRLPEVFVEVSEYDGDELARVRLFTMDQALAETLVAFVNQETGELPEELGVDVGLALETALIEMPGLGDDLRALSPRHRQYVAAAAAPAIAQPVPIALSLQLQLK